MDNGIERKEVHPAELSDAVSVIKTAILQSQARAARGVNQEQLALYYGIGRFISVNTRKRNWGAGIIDGISERLKAELPGLRGFSGRSLKNMRSFYEAWSMLEPNSAIQIAELPKGAETAGLVSQASEMGDSAIQIAEIRQLELTNLPNFPLAEFLSIGFTHHICRTSGNRWAWRPTRLRTKLIRICSRRCLRRKNWNGCLSPRILEGQTPLVG